MATQEMGQCTGKKKANTHPSAKTAFSRLSEEEQALVRAKQQAAKAKKEEAKEEFKRRAADNKSGVTNSSAMDVDSDIEKDYPTIITMDEYFDACPRRTFMNPSIVAKEDYLETVLTLIRDNKPLGQDRRGTDVRGSEFQYFVFGGSLEQIWDSTFYARLAYEGFFTITTSNRPLPELQPFYGVVDWKHMRASKTVKKAMRRLRAAVVRSPSDADTAVAIEDGEETLSSRLQDFHLYSSTDSDALFEKLDAYQKKQNGSNWLSKKYFSTMKAANDDPRINFKLHTIELYDGPVLSAGDASAGALSQGRQPQLLAGEIGYSIGRIYTSLSGFYEADGCGTLQLVALGLWLEQRNYAFWSMGHCYSPHMEYKRQLGHRIYPRTDFLRRLQKHRGNFRLESGAGAGNFNPLADGEECDLKSALR